MSEESGQQRGADPVNEDIVGGSNSSGNDEMVEVGSFVMQAILDPATLGSTPGEVEVSSDANASENSITLENPQMRWTDFTVPSHTYVFRQHSEFSGQQRGVFMPISLQPRPDASLPSVAYIGALQLLGQMWEIGETMPTQSIYLPTVQYIGIVMQTFLRFHTFVYWYNSYPISTIDIAPWFVIIEWNQTSVIDNSGVVHARIVGNLGFAINEAGQYAAYTPQAILGALKNLTSNGYFNP
ncbi:hypothetical protein DICA4_E21286 [Diutina catenulata]